MYSLAESLAIADKVSAILTGWIVIYIAAKGFETWRHQLQVKRDYELAKRINENCYTFQAAFTAISQPGKNPMRPQDNDVQKDDEEYRNYIDLTGRLEAGQEHLNSAMTALHSDAIEASAVWGQGVAEIFTELFHLERDLSNNVLHILLRHSDAPEEMKKKAEELSGKVPIIRFGLPAEGKDDDCIKRLETTCKKMEVFLAPKMQYVPQKTMSLFLPKGKLELSILCAPFVFILAAFLLAIFYTSNRDTPESTQYLENERTQLRAELNQALMTLHHERLMHFGILPNSNSKYRKKEGIKTIRLTNGAERQVSEGGEICGYGIR